MRRPRRTRRSSMPRGRSSHPGSSTSTCTCASRARKTSRRWPPARWRRRPADSPRSARCPTPIRSPTTRPRSGFIVRQSIRAGKARVYPIGAISLGQKGQQLAEFGEMVGAGAVAVSDDGKPVVSSHLMRTALEYAQVFGIPVAEPLRGPDALGAAARCTRAWSPPGSASRAFPPRPKRSWWRATSSWPS